MSSDDEFGPDTETIRAWLGKRASYARDARVIGAHSDGTAPADSSPATLPAALPAAGPDGTDAGRSVLDALRQPEPRPQPPSEPGPSEPAASEPAAREPAAREPAPSEPTHAGTDADFAARGRARLALSLILLCALAGTGVASYVAFEERTVATIGLAGTLGLLSLVIWAARAGCTSTQLTLRRGQLSIERGGVTETVDIANSYHPVAIVGEPGQRRWTVLVERAGHPLVVIDSAMVDPYRFTAALYRIRPELRPRPAAPGRRTE